MVDLKNATSQFHPYQRPEATPHGPGATGRWGLLKKVGVDDAQIESARLRIEALDFESSFNRARDYARQNPGKILGALAALLFTAGLWAMSCRTAAKRFVRDDRSG